MYIYTHMHVYVYTVYVYTKVCSFILTQFNNLFARHDRQLDSVFIFVKWIGSRLHSSNFFSTCHEDECRWFRLAELTALNALRWPRWGRRGVRVWPRGRSCFQAPTLLRDKQHILPFALEAESERVSSGNQQREWKTNLYKGKGKRETKKQWKPRPWDEEMER